MQTKFQLNKKEKQINIKMGKLCHVYINQMRPGLTMLGEAVTRGNEGYQCFHDKFNRNKYLCLKNKSNTKMKSYQT